jgi:predicted short-subunit dehydrogenase-like oxidoreductase (DUF2520 family)
LFRSKPNIAIIGAGKIAYSIVSALKKNGYKVSLVVSKNISSAKELSEKFRIPFYSNQFKSLKKHNIFFITVPDSQIKKVSKRLSSLKLDFPNSLFIHTSGALDVKELNILKKKKAYTASFHIMQTFPSKKIIDIKGCSGAIETESKKAKEFLLKLSHKLKLKPFFLKSGNKIFYHLAGVFASNFLVGNISASEKLLKLSKAGKMNFLSLIDSILNSTIYNVKKVGVAKALSGPVERGDYVTVQKHLKGLRKEDKLLCINYIIQSLHLLDVVEKKNIKLNAGHKKTREILINEFNQLKSFTTYIDKL